MKLWHLAEYDRQCHPCSVLSRRRVLLSSQGGLARWSGLSVFTCAQSASLGAGGLKIQQTHANQNLERLRMPPVLCPLPHQPCDNRSRLAHWHRLVHGHHPIDKAWLWANETVGAPALVRVKPVRLITTLETICYWMWESTTEFGTPMVYHT